MAERSDGLAYSPGGAAAPQQRAPVSLWSNLITYVGLGFVATGALPLVTFFAFQLISPSPNPYIDIFGYLVLPGIFSAGLFLVPAGAGIKLWRLRRNPAAGTATVRLPRIDLNDHRMRRRVVVFVLVTLFLVLPLMAVSSYEAYHYTESSAFCGQACHTVMEPQAVAHSHSPHARVRCAECHIGQGAGWFVKSKLSGARQVLAVWADTFPRPIPPAIQELRPARDTCEECHWPAKFFGSQHREFVHFSPDELNTRRVVRMLLHTGGADETIGRVEGIHMHMLVSGRIEYVATDEALQEIPWVRFVKADGSETVYRSDGRPHDEPPPPGVVRIVDCMDCHNRGAHHIRSPQKAIDLFMEVGRIDPSLPFIKREAVDALSVDYPDKRSAESGIRERLYRFYREQYAAYWQERRQDIEASVEGVLQAYRQNFFPEMKANWTVYPENIGHLESPGCFRCHDGRHVDADGVAITADCNACHSTLVAVEGHDTAVAPGEFRHSMMLVKHETLRCDQCHTGGRLRLCRDCHASGDWLEQRTP
jgi:hypothetical protein